jgi:peptidoglycan/LPS O-acetylase OafA/YrhL
MNEMSAPDPLTERISAQFTTVKALHIGFLEGFGENPWATLLVMGTLLFALAVICRGVIYGMVRLSGRVRLDRKASGTEAVSLWAALFAGFVVGEVFFQNVWLAAITGGLFVIVATGAVLEALTANVRDHAPVPRITDIGMRVRSEQ